MLKIKDNVDLKELEKYGFQYKNSGTRNYYVYEWTIEIDIKTKEIYNATWMDNLDLTIFCDKLYDLIKADLVEKVGE